MLNSTKMASFTLSRTGATAILWYILLFSGYHPVFADPLKAVPAGDVVNQIDNVFGVTLDVRSGVNLQRQVSVAIPKTQNDTSLLSAVNTIATALNADYRKVFVISFAVGGAPIPTPIIDASGSTVSFDNETQNAANAISTVASLDDATVQTTFPILGSVTFSNRKLGLPDAVRQIEMQTHTQWKVAYVLTPHTSRTSTAGRIVGYSSAGQPIIQMPNVLFPVGPSTASDGASGSPDDLDSLDPNTATPEQMRQGAYRSAIMRGDISAAVKFQPTPP